MNEEDIVAEGLIEFLQGVAPDWATKLSQERLATLKVITELNKRCFDAENALEEAEAELQICRQEAQTELQMRREEGDVT